MLLKIAPCKIFSQLFLTVLMALCASFGGPKAFAGPGSSGGGGVVYRNGKPILLDFLIINPEFKDQDTFETWQASRLPSKKIAPFSFGSAQESQVRAQLSPADLAFHVIEQWEKAQFDYVAHTIHYSFYAPLTWQFVDQKFETPRFFIPPSVLPGETVKIAGYYYRKDKNYSVSLSLPIWNQMGIFSQAGLMVHETLRQQQIGWSREFDEETLDRATALVMMCKPQVRLNFYLNWLIQNKPEVARAIYGDYDDMIKNNCVRTL